METEQKIKALVFVDGGQILVGYPLEKNSLFKCSSIKESGAWVEVFTKKDGDNQPEYLALKIPAARVKGLMYEIPNSTPRIEIVR